MQVHNNQTASPPIRLSWILPSRPGPGMLPSPVRSDVWIDGHELDAEFLDSLDEPDKVCLICHGASQDGGARVSLQLHAVEQDSKRIAQLPTKDQPVTAGLHRAVVHNHAALHSGSRPVITFGRIHLGETFGRPGQVTRSSRPFGRRRMFTNNAGRRWMALPTVASVAFAPEGSLEEAQLAAAFERVGPRRHGKLAVDRPDVAMNRVVGNIQFTTDISL